MLKNRLPAVDKIQAAIAKDFKGGLNTFDTDLNMSSRFLTECINLYPDTNGALRLRYGTTLFADLVSDIDSIINVTYFNGFLVAVGANGVVMSVTSGGISSVIWNNTIASALPGAPTGWSNGLTFISFAQFKGELIICNGVDKPILVASDLTVTYLQDLGTGSNVNVPRARLVVAHNNYLVFAVTPTESDLLYITSKGTSGTFVGDPGVDNDAVNFPLGSYITQGATAIVGMSTFRDELVVAFRETSLVLRLGGYDSTVHVPVVSDVIPSHGAISHRCLAALGDDLLLMDGTGVSSMQKAVLSDSLTPQRETVLIAADVQQALSIFSLQQLADRIFCVHDRIHQHVLFFVPNALSQTDCKVFVYCYDRSQRFKAWTTFSQMNYTSGCRSEEGRVFLSQGTKLYYYRNQFDPVYTDYSISEAQPWSDGTFWDDGTGWVGLDGTFTGTDIPFSMATPKSNMRDPIHTKHSRYLSIDMEGDADVTVEMFIDRFPTAALSMSFTQTNMPQGTGVLALRPINNEQLYAWPSKFIRAQLRMSGSTNRAMKIVALGLLYLKGSIRR